MSIWCRLIHFHLSFHIHHPADRRRLHSPVMLVNSLNPFLCRLSICRIQTSFLCISVILEVRVCLHLPLKEDFWDLVSRRCGMQGLKVPYLLLLRSVASHRSLKSADYVATRSKRWICPYLPDSADTRSSSKYRHLVRPDRQVSKRGNHGTIHRDVQSTLTITFPTICPIANLYQSGIERLER